jgi:UDP-glucuronate 4-epimerase
VNAVSYQSQRKRYLVTGCAGFIASKVCKFLLDEGNAVVGADNLNDAYDRKLKEWRLEEFRGQSSFSFFNVDISNKADVSKLFTKQSGPARNYDGVINLAARAGVRKSVEDPWVYIRTNVEGTLNLLEACQQSQIKKFVLASTSSLYAGNNPVPFSEDSDTNSPQSPYTASKKAAEVLAYTYHHLYGIDVSVVRYFTVYGPAGRPDMSIFRFVRKIYEEETLSVFGDGLQERDFTYVDDIARGTIAALRPLGYEIINLGGDRQVTLMDLINMISSEVGRVPSIKYYPSHPADIRSTWADISKARKILGWAPQVSLEEGIRRTVRWYIDNRDRAILLSTGEE